MMGHVALRQHGLAVVHAEHRSIIPIPDIPAEITAEAFVCGSRIKLAGKVGYMLLKLPYVGKSSVDPVLDPFLYAVAGVLQGLLTQVSLE